MKRKTTAAKASLTSKRSMSEMDIPLSFKIFSVTGTGPVSMIVGSDPIFAVARTTARGLSPRVAPNSLEPIKMPAAPSTMPDELPAWWIWLIRSRCGYFISATLSKLGMVSPKSLKAGFKAPSDCMSVPGRGYSSWVKMGRPLRSLTAIKVLSKRPSALARSARFWLSTAKQSACARVKPYSVAIISAEIPCGTK